MKTVYFHSYQSSVQRLGYITFWNQFSMKVLRVWQKIYWLPNSILNILQWTAGFKDIDCRGMHVNPMNILIKNSFYNSQQYNERLVCLLFSPLYCSCTKCTDTICIVIYCNLEFNSTLFSDFCTQTRTLDLITRIIWKFKLCHRQLLETIRSIKVTRWQGDKGVCLKESSWPLLWLWQVCGPHLWSSATNFMIKT